MSNQNILSVFVDESGNFGDSDDPARYCIVTLVFHDQVADISQYVKELNRSNYDLGLDSDSFRFHMGPLIRQEDEYAAMSRPMRGKILDRMMTFVRKVDFKYHCILELILNLSIRHSKFLIALWVSLSILLKNIKSCLRV